ncbi:MAG: NADH-quinone oxidoreductase subunit F [Rhodospirillales bacterium]|jgi:formate dehydrogenase|nr:NADH-quinone oxidoreductase subunit F [Rhodospirillales bacterium]MBT5033868.1 NADH-quinone oxidoreductase subunit F [Rhodospirillaceae bacterium]MBT7487818.1 NADH-quinone oxidoreductase subunit F [Rhodospirillales bacterium]MBT8004922.1 NADH-quinone oxidoreductase subunit F [Rhodospirillales bacterium]
MLDDATPQNRSHPGLGQRRASAFNKGRQLSPVAHSEIKDLLLGEERTRDRLVEYLHQIQDAYGKISTDHLRALAEELRLSMAEVFEVASFYAHFDIDMHGDTGTPKTTVRVCDSLTCEMFGAKSLSKYLGDHLDDNIQIVTASCMGRCDMAPVVEVGHRHVGFANLEKVISTIESKEFTPEIPKYLSYNDYIKGEGYTLLNDCYAGKYNRDDLIDLVQKSGLRGMGGAGFPAGLKWKSIREQPKPRLMAINADEGEPGTFKDRHYLEGDPHRFLEGMLIAAWVCEVEKIYIYVRDEYPAARDILIREINTLRSEGLLDNREIELRRGAGAYICGEESAMLDSIEGKRGLPRQKPPYPTQVGLFGQPSLIHNVETVYWIRSLINRGPEWFSDQGLNGCKGFHSFSVSGRVKNAGVKRAPAGITITDLINDYCGGMQDGHQFKAYLPGGASGGILPASLSDLPLAFGTLEEHGCFVGSAAVIVLSDQDSIKDVSLNLMRFFEDESCGQCTPCRTGTEKAVQLMREKTWDQDLLMDLSTVMVDASICGLGQAAPNPVLCAMKYFPEEL